MDFLWLVKLSDDVICKFVFSKKKKHDVFWALQNQHLTTQNLHIQEFTVFLFVSGSVVINAIG